MLFGLRWVSTFDISPFLIVFSYNTKNHIVRVPLGQEVFPSLSCDVPGKQQPGKE